MKLRFLYIFFLLIIHAVTCLAGKAQENLRRGVDYAMQDNFPMALKHFTRSMEEAQQEGDKHTMAVSMGYIGNVYYNIDDFTRCLQYLLKGYDLSKEQRDSNLQINFLTNIVGAYAKQGNAEKAWEYYRLMEQMPPGKDPTNTHYYLLYNRARIAHAEHNDDEAIAWHGKALDWAEQKKMARRYALYQYCEIGQLYLAKGDGQKALEYGLKCEKPASDDGEVDLLTSVYVLLADAYGLQGDHQSESRYRSRYLALSDSLFNRKGIFSADDELVEYETRQTNDHINSLGRTINMQTMAIVAFSILLVALAVVSLLLFRNNRKLKLAHHAVLDKNRELQRQQDKEQRLMQRILQQPAPDGAENAPEPLPNSVGISHEQARQLTERVVSVMDDICYISNPDFSLNALAEAVDSNTRYVSWVVNETYGKNFKTLLNERRIREACRRLSDREHYGNLTIQAVYEGVGYTNAVSFIRAFRKINGMTPSEYQKAACENFS